MPSEPIAQPELDRLIARRAAFRMMGISVATGLRLENFDPTFPRPVLVGGRGQVQQRAYFIASELNAWLTSRPRMTAEDSAKVEQTKAAAQKSVAVRAQKSQARARVAA